MDTEHQPPGDEDDERKAKKNTRRDAGHPNEAHRSDRFTSMTGHNQIVAMKEMSTQPERTSTHERLHHHGWELGEHCTLSVGFLFPNTFP
jgi:hypothetical protein